MIQDQIEEGSHTYVKKSHADRTNIPVAAPMDSMLVRMGAHASKCVITEPRKLSINLSSRKILNNRHSFYLDMNFGPNIIYIGEDSYTGRTRKFLKLYLTDEDTPEARIANNQNSFQANEIYEKVIDYVSRVKRGEIFPAEVPITVDEPNTEIHNQTDKRESSNPCQDAPTVIDSFVLTEEEEKTYHESLKKLDQLFSE